MHHDNSDLDYGDYSEVAPTTKTVWQSVFVIAMALGLGVGAFSLLRVHSIASEAGFFVWMVVTLGASFVSAYYVVKAMAAYHLWARLIVGAITFLSIALVLTEALAAFRIQT